MKDFFEIGYQLARGAIYHIALVVLIFFAANGLFNLARNTFRWGLDNSDKDGWSRSGLKVHVDHKTGIEYLSDGRGGLVERSKSNKKKEDSL